MSKAAPPPISDHLPLAIRAFAEKRIVELRKSLSGKPKRKASATSASPWTLVFDTETTTDAGQALRFGTYQVRKNGELHCAGIFYAPHSVTPPDHLRLKSHAKRHNLDLLTRDEFADQIFYKIGYQLRASIVGFNLPFDISRIALSHDSARNEMRGGFTFKISTHKYWPNVRVKHLSRRAAFIRFAGPMKQIDNRSDRKWGRKNGFRAGHFIDVKTLSAALFSRSFSLASLCDFLKIENPKLSFDDFDGPITQNMIRYAVRDTQATWECYAELIARYSELGLTGVPPEKIFSEASIGKAYLKAMGIAPWQKAQPDFPRQMLANIMGSYFGGRSEIRIRRKTRQVILCDFLSMYPTVCTLMRLWRFVIADGMTWRDATAETQAFLETVDIAAMQSPDIWQRLTTLVCVIPEADIFPVRASYSGEPQSTIGLNWLSGDGPLWFTLADCIASKLQTGKAPKVIEAITFSPGPVQAGLSAINVSGNPDYRVDPVEADFFKRVIELRQVTKVRRDAASGRTREALETEQNALKIAANATAYGVYVETNVADLAKPVAMTIHGSTCEPFSFQTDKAEEAGPYYHPLLATLICGAARLMLAMTERLVIDQGLDWSICDTDSMAIAKPDAMDADTFQMRVARVVDWFASLNPYDFEGSILQIEKANFSISDVAKPEPLYCWAISAKRYALFNIDGEGNPAIRKASAHGLGHLIAPYSEINPAPEVPKPVAPLASIGVELWQHDYWWQVLTAALGGSPDQVDRSYHPALNAPAMSRYAATTPALLNWFKTYNKGRAYCNQVKPFNFLLSMIADPFGSIEPVICDGSKSRPRKAFAIKPVAPFGRDVLEMAKVAFDRESGNPVASQNLKSFASALAGYHLQPESKFLNANYFDRGITRRRHVFMTATRHIGKEANDWERQAYLGLDVDALPGYGMTGDDAAKIIGPLNALIARTGMGRVSQGLKIPAAKLRAFKSGHWTRSHVALAALVKSRIPALIKLADRLANDREAELRQLKEAIERDGLRKTGRRLGIDASNLSRRLASPPSSKQKTS